MLIYSLLHLTGYDLPMEELKTSVSCTLKLRVTRKWVTAGVETTTGPLGQGIANAVGMAIAEKRWRRSLTVRATTLSTTTPTPSWATAA